MKKLLREEKKKRPTSVIVGPNTKWTDYHGVQELAGIRRGLAYHLSATGAIQSVSLKGPGENRGKRLFFMPSIWQYLNSKLENAQKGSAKPQRVVARLGGTGGQQA